MSVAVIGYSGLQLGKCWQLVWSGVPGVRKDREYNRPNAKRSTLAR